MYFWGLKSRWLRGQLVEDTLSVRDVRGFLFLELLLFLDFFFFFFE